MISVIVDIYLGGVLFLSLWLGWSLYRSADEHDWRHRKSDLWLGYIFDCLFWPLFLPRNPKALLKGSSFQSTSDDPLTDISKRQAERMRRLEQMTESPPACGNQVKYQHDHWGESGTEIIFNSADIESHFKGKQLPLFHIEECRAIISFIKGRRDDWSDIELIPDDINFERMAFELIDAGYGEVQCSECEKLYPVSGLSNSKPPIHGGWNAENFSCQEGHALLKHDYMHVHLSPT